MKTSESRLKASGARKMRDRLKPERRPAPAAGESNRLVAAVRNFAAKIAGLVISDRHSAELAARWRLEIDAQERRVLQRFAPSKQAAFKAHATICRRERRALAPCREARRMLNSKLAAWYRSLSPASIKRRGAAPGSPGADGAPQLAGISFRDNWRVEVTDKCAFVSAIAADPEMLNLIAPNLPALKLLAQAHKGVLPIPGVRAWCEPLVTARPEVPSGGE